VPGYETGSWYGVVVPAGTPKGAIDRLSREIQTIVKSQDITSKLNEEAVIPVGSTPEAFDKHIRSELARWAKVIKAANIELE
jgi:tripartite-type tricarboxylate transporter receptor subunit TctC